jgi:TnpA family transposase
VSAIQDTAYPRLKSDLSPKELAAIFTPTADDYVFVEQLSSRKPTQALILLQLKVVQRLGYFEPASALPRNLIEHVCRHAKLREPSSKELKAYETSGSRSIHQKKIRDHLGLRFFRNDDWAWVEKLARDTAATKQELEDIVNVLIEDIARQKYELPGFTQLVRTARNARNIVNTAIYQSITGCLTTEQCAMLDDIMAIRRGKTLWDQLKKEPKKPTVREVAQFLEHIRWLTSLNQGLPNTRTMAVSKRRQLILEARALDAKDIKAVKPIKRYALATLLIQSQLERSTDDIATIFIKLVRGINNQAEERLRQYRIDHAEQTDRLIGQFREVLAAMQEGETANDRLDNIERVLGDDPETWIEQCDEHAAFAGNNHIPFMLKPYSDKRALIYQCLDVLELKSSSQDEKLVHALSWIREWRHARREFFDERHVPAGIDLKKWLPDAWYRHIVQKTESGAVRIHRKYLEIYICKATMDEMQSGDLYAEHSNDYDDYREHLVSWDEYGGELSRYCDITKLPKDGATFAARLKEEISLLAKHVDSRFPENDYVRINDSGLVIQRIDPRVDPPDLALVEERLKAGLPSTNILDLLTETESWLDLHRIFGPLSGFEPKIDDPRKRFITTLFCYGCNLGPAQTARSVQGLSRKQVGWLNLRYVTEERLDKAIVRVINAFNTFALPKFWGSGKRVSADGTKWSVFEQNLLSEFHIRYGGYGGIGYYHVSDMYIALFSNFIPCGVHESMYLLDGLIRNTSDVQPDTVHGDTHAQTTPVFGLAHLLGIEVMPRIKGIKQLIFYKPDRKAKYDHIQSLFKEVIDWSLIERHYPDMMRVAISIKAGLITPSMILRRLGVSSRKNKLYLAFRELGRAIRTRFLLNYINDVELRRVIHQATNKSEQFNDFAKWLRFANDGVIAENIRHEQRKVVKYNHLVANMVILHNVHTMSRTLKILQEQGVPLNDDLINRLSPYRREHINRLGHYPLDLERPKTSMANDIKFSF